MKFKGCIYKRAFVFALLVFCFIFPTACGQSNSMAPEPRAQSESAQAHENPLSQPLCPSANLTPLPKINLSGLTHKGNGYGPGANAQNGTAPLGATSAQKENSTYGGVYIGPEEYIYLTFDCGYENGNTETILDALAKTGVRATFFITLPFAQENPNIVMRMIDEGHVIGNHSARHLQMPTLQEEQALSEITDMHDYVLEGFGYEMRLFRFPEGYASPYTMALANNAGYRSIFWSFAYLDWDPSAQPEPAGALEKVCGAVHPGAIYLLHAVSATNAEILPEMIARLQEQGYVFATL